MTVEALESASHNVKEELSVLFAAGVTRYHLGHKAEYGERTYFKYRFNFIQIVFSGRYSVKRVESKTEKVYLLVLNTHVCQKLDYVSGEGKSLYAISYTEEALYERRLLDPILVALTVEDKAGITELLCRGHLSALE